MGIFWKSKKQKEAEKIAPQLLQTAQQCTEIVNTTKNPHIFFQNYDLMLEKLNALAKIQYSIKIKGHLPTDILRTIQDKKPFTFEEFINRYYQQTLQKLEKQTTISQKEKVIRRFQEELNQYENRFEERNKKQIMQLCQELTQKANNSAD